MKGTFYWHDYETFGVDPMRDRPVQFAGLRTDADLNIISDPLVIYARPATDVLPQPGACLVTGITPQIALEKGVPEAEFIRQIHAELAQPGTCGVGYNTIRFDDEVGRHTLYRNFYDAYAREYQNGNSRWDIIDMLRAAFALRPEGINWPLRDDGLPSFKLEHLTAANGIGHTAAHDALADVHATIAIAKLVKTAQPRLFDYLLENRSKRQLEALLDIQQMKPVLHVSGKFSAARHCIALVVPLARHPVNKNEIICYDLSADPGPLLELDVEALRERLFTPARDLPEGVDRLALKSIRLNRCPVLVTARMLDQATATRLEIDVASCRAVRARLQAASGLSNKISQLYSEREFAPISNPDHMLYSGGFFSDGDRAAMTAVREAVPEELLDSSFQFTDERLPELLLRYKARNYPGTLTAEEASLWEEYRFQYLTDPEQGASICLEAYLAEIESKLAEPELPERDRQLLNDLLDYSDLLLG
ncbi:MAG: exodeoxyribonuclease-1 [Halieaceae bacterium]|jgi:exodeoxyribonuclease-1